VRRLGERIGQARERIATIDRELERLETWDSQATYNTAMSELNVINAIFAAEEEREQDERAVPMANEEETPVGQGETRMTAPSVPSEEVALADILVALAQQERASENWDEQPTLFPSATASLAWMAAEVERLIVARPLCLEPMEAEEPEAEGIPALAAEVGFFHTSRKARVQFGDTLGQRRVPRAQGHDQYGAEVHQLSLF
jgi:hypothetical protein